MARSRPNLPKGTLESMNKWQDECFCKGHDDEIYSLCEMVSSSIPDRNNERDTLRSTKAYSVLAWDIKLSRHDAH